MSVPQNEILKNIQRTMGEKKMNDGMEAYSKTSGVFGLFSVIDRGQSFITGYAMTQAVADIREGAEVIAKANKP